MTNVEKSLICDALIRLLMVQETTSLRIVDTDELRGAVKAANAIKPDQDYTEDDLPPWKSESPEKDIPPIDRESSIADMADYMIALHKSQSEPTEKQKTIALMASSMCISGMKLDKIASLAQELYDQVIKQTNKQ